MARHLEEKDNTRDKILEVASELFAEKGFQNTTVRDICKKSGAYQLSINYHFGGKENLFREVLLKAYQDTYEANIQEKVKDLPPEEKLEAIIHARVHSIFSNDKRGYFFKMTMGESFNECESAEKKLKEPLMKDYFHFVRSVFAEISENTFSEFELNYCAYLLVSHISLFSMFKKAKAILFNPESLEQECENEKDYNPTEEELENFIHYVKKFIFAGVEKMKEEKIQINK